MSKRLFLLRHGQALHNPRAEKAMAAGCSHAVFMQTMKEDDALDADLTPLGRRQAQAACEEIDGGSSSLGIELLVASSLSRAVETAMLAFPEARALQSPGPARDVIPCTWPRAAPCPAPEHAHLLSSLQAAAAGPNTFLALESLRERIGWMLCGKRRTQAELSVRFPGCRWGGGRGRHRPLPMLFSTVCVTERVRILSCGARVRGPRWKLGRGRHAGGGTDLPCWACCWHVWHARLC
jgi:hypothetical protein